MKTCLHRSLSLLLALVLALTLAVPVLAVEPEESALALSQTSADLRTGETLTLTAVLPTESEGQTLTWTSSEPSVATVSDEGVVTAVKQGQATITATLPDGETSAACTVTVDNYVVDVSIQPLSPGTLAVGKQITLSAFLSYKYKTETPGEVLWSSSDPGVATVDEDGLVTALSEGRATITASAADKGYDGAPIVDVYKLTVVPVGGDAKNDVLTLAPTARTLTGSLSVPMLVHAPAVTVMNGTTDVTDRFTISYVWTGGTTVYPGGETLTLTPTANQELVCTVTAVSNTDDTHILTEESVFTVQLISGAFAEAALDAKAGDTPLSALVGGVENRSIADQLKGQISGLTAVTFDLTDISGDDVGSLTVQKDVAYSLDDAGENPLSAIVFSPNQPGEYSIGFTAAGDEDWYGRLNLTVTGEMPEIQPPEDTSPAIPCPPEGITMTRALSTLLPSGDPVVAVSFGTPKYGHLLRDFAYGSGVPDNAARYSTTAAGQGSFPLSTLTYVPKAGFTGTEYLPATLIYASGASLQTTFSITVEGRTDSAAFSDVTADTVGSWCAGSVDFANACGLMNGVGEGLFAPYDVMSRAMVVTVLYRMEGSPAVTGESVFADVDSAAYYANAVRWATANGIVNGDGLGNFLPNDPLTREQLAAILYRYAGFKGQSVAVTGTLAAFTDAAAVSGYATDGLVWAVERGIVSGIGDNLLAPQNSATRAQVAVMLHRFLTL